MNHQILEDGLANDRGSLQQPELCITEGVANITLYKAWPDAHVSKSRRLMAIDGWKDGRSGEVISMWN